MRAISDYLAKEFAARGIPALSDHRLFDGHQILSFPDGKNIFVSPFASDAEISAAVFKAFNMTDDNIETTPEAPKPSELNEAARTYLATADKMPAVQLVPTAEKPKTGNPIPAGSHPPGTLAALLKALRDRKAAVIDGAISEAKRAHKALDHVERVTGDMSATTDGIMSELGQFSNLSDE